MSTDPIRHEVEIAIQEIERGQARLRRALASVGEGDAAAVVQVPREGPWTLAKLVALRPYLDDLPGIRTLLDLCAATPNEPVTYSDLLARTSDGDRHDADMRQRGENRRLTEILKSEFDGSGWPIQRWQASPRADRPKAEMLFRMGGTVAAWWTGL